MLKVLGAVGRRGMAASVVAALVATGAVAVAMAQGSGSPDPGPLAAVVAELRQLRLAVEESTRSQNQTQTMTAVLSAQQTRLSQATARLDAARKTLDDAVLRSKEVTVELSAREDALARSGEAAKGQPDGYSQNLKRSIDQIAHAVQQAQQREAELAQVLRAEEARWSELVANLEQVARKK
jgi:hypothetical protein